jgi:hypothetical protein
MRKRVRAARAADLIRRFDYRQRNHARGAWFRLRRLLSDAATAWQISALDSERLRACGIALEPVGFEVEPPIAIHVVSPEQLQTLGSRQPLAVRLSAELLRARCLALVAWPAKGTDAGR